MFLSRNLVRISRFGMITTRQLSNRTEKISEITSTKDSHEAALEDVRTEPEKIPETFASLLRNSKFVQMGDPCGKVVVGRIYHVVDDDIYIDFGGKFPCVCQRPKQGGFLYTRGTEVRVAIKSFEMSRTFLGFDREMTLCEADCVLLGLHRK